MDTNNTSDVKACPVCAGSSEAVVSCRNGYKIYCCNQCRHRFVDPSPSDEDLVNYYSGFNWRKPDGQVSDDFIERNAARFLMISNKIEETGPLLGKDLLDWGCGVGLDALGFSSCGWQVSVTDIDQDALAYARTVLPTGATVYSSPDEVLSSGAKFDVIWCAHVIEHYADPSILVRQLSGLLKENGVVVLSTPNAESLEYLFRVDLIARYLLDEKFVRSSGWRIKRFLTKSWIYVDPPRHLSIYSAESLRREFARTGMETVVCHSEFSPWAVFNIRRAFDYSLVRPRSALKIIRNLLPHALAWFLRAGDRKQKHGDSLIAIIRIK